MTGCGLLMLAEQAKKAALRCCSRRVWNDTVNDRADNASLPKNIPASAKIHSGWKMVTDKNGGLYHCFYLQLFYKVFDMFKLQARAW